MTDPTTLDICEYSEFLIQVRIRPHTSMQQAIRSMLTIETLPESDVRAIFEEYLVHELARKRQEDSGI